MSWSLGLSDESWLTQTSATTVMESQNKRKMAELCLRYARATLLLDVIITGNSVERAICLGNLFLELIRIWVRFDFLCWFLKVLSTRDKPGNQQILHQLSLNLVSLENNAAGNWIEWIKESRHAWMRGSLTEQRNSTTQLFTSTPNIPY